MKYRILKKKLKRNKFDLWVESTRLWLCARDVARLLDDTASKIIAIKFIDYNHKQAIRAGNKAGITRPSQIMKYFNNELRKLYYGKE